MKLDSISSISEIAKYYGYLDEVFRLLNRLNTKTRDIWRDTQVEMARYIQRKWSEVDLNDRKVFVEIPIENRFVFSLFNQKVVLAST